MGQVNSMTAFVQSRQSAHERLYTFEIRAVNHRFLEIHYKLPEALRFLEPALRQCATQRLHRGKLDITLKFSSKAPEDAAFNINPTVATQLTSLIQSTHSYTATKPHVNALDFLSWPNLLEPVSLAENTIQEDCLLLFNQALDELIHTRGEEGLALKQFVKTRIEQLHEHIQVIETHAPMILQQLREKMTTRLEEVTAERSHDRLEQEMVYWAQKLDIEEELSRFKTHLTAINQQLEKGGAIGRRLDFLLQELLRECNTIGSKIQQHTVTTHVIEIKVLLEQIREQVQNIE